MTRVETIEYFAQRLFDLQRVALPKTTLIHEINHAARTITDYISGDGRSEVKHQSGYQLRHCTRWSKAAIALFDSLKTKMSESKCYSHKENGKCVFIVEHQYPVSIIKKLILNKEFADVAEIIEHFNLYGNCVVVTREEDAKLNVKHKSTDSIIEARLRYLDNGIEVVQKK